MADGSAIEWTDATWNPIRARRTIMIEAGGAPPPVGIVQTGWHCEHASEGCRNCYAEGFNRRLGTKLTYKPGHLRTAQRPGGEVELFLDEKMLLLPLKWRAPRKIFVGSMTDIFADFVGAEMLDRMFAVMALCPQHVFQVLTKRPERMRRYVANRFDTEYGSDHICEAAESIGIPDPCNWPQDIPNIWLGTSIEDRPNLLARAGHLRKTPAAVRFFSCEPLLGDLGDVVLSDIDWVICGGESGPHARPMHPDWARSLRDQCAFYGVPFFFKQWGSHSTIFDRDVEDPDWKRCAEIARLNPKGRWLNVAGGHGFHGARVVFTRPVDKKVAGRLLDGVEHNAMPRLAA